MPLNMDLKKPLGYVRRAVDDYHMISPHDRVAVGVSGGKDSTLLLATLAALRDFYPHPFLLGAIRVDLGFFDTNDEPLRALCEKINVPYTVITTQIGTIVFDVRHEANPCSLCTKMRRGAIAKGAAALGYNKLAFAHHRDDVIETFLLNLIQEGRLGAFSPVTEWDKSGITLIRPMIYMEEKDVRYACIENALPIMPNKCPADGKTKRAKVKDLIVTMQMENKDVKAKLFGAVQRARLDGFKPNNETK